MKKIKKQSTVIMHFVLRTENGDVAKNTYEEKPVKFTMGDGSFSDVFEAALLGMCQGEKIDVTLLPEDAFGDPNPRNIHHMPREKFSKEMDLDVGSVIQFNQGGNEEIYGIVKKSDDAQVTIDFNHPLSGRTLTFEVEVVDVV